MTTTLNCSRCSAEIFENDIFCRNCGYPENGDQKEKDRYDYRIKLKKDVLDEAKKKLKSVQMLVLFIAGINLLFGIYYLSDDITFADGIASLISATVYLGCFFWVKRQPLTGVLAAFIFWILLQLSVILVDPALLFSGILMKIFFIGIFVKGISSAKDAKSYTEQLKEMHAV